MNTRWALLSIVSSAQLCRKGDCALLDSRQAVQMNLHRLDAGDLCRGGGATQGRRLDQRLAPRRAAVIAATSIFFMSIIASNVRRASSPPIASASVSTRGVICQLTPHLSLHQPHALSWPPLPTMAF